MLAGSVDFEIPILGQPPGFRLLCVSKLSHLQKCLFIQTLRYAQNYILGISVICLGYNFSHTLILNENPIFAKGSV